MKSRMVEEQDSRNIIRAMLALAWMSFVASMWVGILSLKYEFFSFGIFWLILVIILAATLGAWKKEK